VEGALSHVRVFPVMGRRVRVVTNDARVLGLVAAAFGHWDGLDACEIVSGADAELRVVVTGGPEERPELLVPTYRVAGEVLLAGAGGALMQVDRGSGVGRVFLPACWLGAPLWARRHFLECGVLFLATAVERVPLHASAVLVGETAVVVLGGSCAGKSTLTFALHGRGHRVIGEECVCVGLVPSLTLWGGAIELGLRPEAISLFPGLEVGVAVQPNGKRKGVVRIDAPVLFHRGAVRMVFLTGADGGAELVSPEGVFGRLMAGREPGFDLAAGYEPVARALAGAGPAVALGRLGGPGVMAGWVEDWVGGNVFLG